MPQPAASIQPSPPQVWHCGSLPSQITHEKAISADYLKSLVTAYNYFFYHYRDTPLLVVETNEIDFVERKGDLEDLIQQITRPFRGTQIYVPRGSK